MISVRFVFYVLIALLVLLSVTLSHAVTFTQLTNNSGQDIQPSWSHDGSRIVFLSERGGQYGMWIMPAVGGTPTLLSPSSGLGVWGPFGEQEPEWSPNDDTIVYQSTAESYWDIYTIPSSGGESDRITYLTDCVGPNYSPDGDAIIFRHLSGGYHLWKVPSSGGTPSQLCTSSSSENYPSYSPDGSKIIFEYSADENVYSINSSDCTEWTRLTYSWPRDGVEPEYSPDGKWIAFSSQRSGKWDIWVVDARGEAYGLYQITNGEGNNIWASWSPDSRTLVFSSDRTGNEELWIVTDLPMPLCGDANSDGTVSVSDVIYLINYLFKGGSAPNPFLIGDVNGDEQLSVTDVVYLISYLFKGGPQPGCPEIPSEDILFFDDFSDGDDSGWVHTGWQDTNNGTWTVENQIYKGYDPYNWTSDAQSHTGQHSWDDYSITVKVKLGEGRHHFSVLGRVQDNKNYYEGAFDANWNGNVGSWWIGKTVDGSPSYLVQVADTIDATQWYSVKMELEGSTISLYVNGQLKLTANNNTYSQGKIGLRVEDGINYFDDVMVKTIF